MTTEKFCEAVNVHQTFIIDRNAVNKLCWQEKSLLSNVQEPDFQKQIIQHINFTHNAIFLMFFLTFKCFFFFWNLKIIDWQMETADGRTHENQVQENAFLQFAQEQC